MMPVRRATLADRAAAMAIAGAGMREFGIEPEFETLDIEIARLGADGPGLRLDFVAEDAGRVVGCIAVVSYDGSIGKLSGFYVDPSQRGRGTGRALLQAAVDAARAAGLAELKLLTWGAMASAVALYEKSGWQRGADPAPEEGAERAYRLRLRM